jgi:hypothetical protein
MLLEKGVEDSHPCLLSRPSIEASEHQRIR